MYLFCLNRRLLRSLILFLYGFLFGCVSGVHVKELKYSLDELRHAIAAVAVEVRWSDDKKRRFESRYFILEEDLPISPDPVTKGELSRFKSETSPATATAEKNEKENAKEKAKGPSSDLEEDWEALFDADLESSSSSPNSVTSISPLIKKERRAFARFMIVGDRRPYHVVIQVIEEEKINDTWKMVRKNEPLAHRLAEELRLYLEKGRVERNAIDSLKPF